ncbi:MAG: hypothetical protein Q9214_002261 [Letrouitia sp. 1 TL-2023]
MATPSKRSKLVRRLFHHVDGSDKALRCLKAQRKDAELRSSSIASLRGPDYDTSNLWSEVFDLFAASNESPDLKAIAKLLQNESKAQGASLSTNEGKKSELEKGAGSPFKRQLRHAYDEVVTWTEKFVTLGDVISQADPVHIELPWAGVRAVLIISIHDRKTQAEILDGVAYLSRLICRKLGTYEDYLQNERRKAISDWVSKIAYYSYHREMKARVMPETGQWLLERQEFRDWVGCKQPPLLWLKGNVGTGKTSLITCVVESFLQKSWLDSREVMAYFYCSRTTSDTRQNDPRAILLSILRQLAAPLPGLPLRPLIVSVYDKEAARGSHEAQLSIEEIKTLLVDLIEHHYQNVTLVIDALDECDAKGRSKLLDILTNLTYNPNTIVKTIVSSRNDPDIESHFIKTPNLSVTATDNAGDIMRFVSKEINERLLGGKASKQMRERVEEYLNERANGVFHWVSMQADTLCDPDHVYGEDDVDYLLSKLPGTLEETYAKILNDLDAFSPPSREAIKNTCRLLICAGYSIATQELLEALAILSDSRKAAVDKAAILKISRSLIVEDLGQTSLIFAHLSVREFLETKMDLSGQQAHLVATEACLKHYLRSEFKSFENSDFRWYARSQGLVEGFFLAKDSNDAFEKWNRDSFDELSVILSNEKEVRSFNDFINPIIKSCEGALYAKNSFGERPLEVAALYGNFKTMVILYNAISPTNLSSTRAKYWLVAAAKSRNLDIWNYAIV